MRKLLGRNDIEDALKRLDTLTVEEGRMAIAEILIVWTTEWLYSSKVGEIGFPCHPRIPERDYD